MELTHVLQQPTGTALRLAGKNQRNVLAGVCYFGQSK
jgi:hypothetical protein